MHTLQELALIELSKNLTFVPHNNQRWNKTAIENALYHCSPLALNKMSRNASVVGKSFTKHDGYQASGRVLRTMTVTVDADCGSQCVAEPACDAFNVETGLVDGTRGCELMTTDNESPAVIAAAGWATYIGKYVYVITRMLTNI